MRETPNFLRYPRERPVCEQRLRTREGLASRGIFCSLITAASTSSGVDLGLLMIVFAAARRSAQSLTFSLRRSFFTILLIFAMFLLSKRHSDRLQQRTGLIIISGRRYYRNIHSARLVDLVKINLRKDQLFADA